MANQDVIKVKKGCIYNMDNQDAIKVNKGCI